MENINKLPVSLTVECYQLWKYERGHETNGLCETLLKVVKVTLISLLLIGALFADVVYVPTRFLAKQIFPRPIPIQEADERSHK